MIQNNDIAILIFQNQVDNTGQSISIDKLDLEFFFNAKDLVGRPTVEFLKEFDPALQIILSEIDRTGTPRARREVEHNIFVKVCFVVVEKLKELEFALEILFQDLVDV